MPSPRSLRTRSRRTNQVTKLQPLGDLVQSITRAFDQRGVSYTQSAYIMKLVRKNLGLAPEVKPKRLPEIISWEEADRIIARAYRMKPVYGLIVKFLWMTMVRVGELVALEVPDIHADDRYAKVRGGKGGKDRLIPIPTVLAQELTSYIGGRRRGTVFVSKWRKPFSSRRIEQVVRQARLGARIDRRVTPHTFRRSMATVALNRGVREEVVSTILGHESTETTRAAYARLSVQTMTQEVERVFSARPPAGAP